MTNLDLEIVSLCAGIYQYQGDVQVVWDHFDDGTDDEVCWALKHFDDHDAIIFRGSSDLQDWIIDFRAYPVITSFGTVHDGFHVGLDKVWQEIKPMLRNPVVLGGHSLGAGRVSPMAAIMKKDGVAPIARYTFGEPKPGFQDLADYIVSVPGKNYRNGDGKEHHDLITDLPFTITNLGLDYVHPLPMTDVVADPTITMIAAWGLFSFHHIWLYRQALGGPNPPADLKGMKNG